MRLVAIIQARTGSTRLPGKVLMPLGSRRVLEHVIDRTRASQAFAEVCVATTENAADDEVARIAAGCGASVVRGSELDVLSRYAKAAEATRADGIARITSDCPLIDPDVLAGMAAVFLAGQASDPPVQLVTNARVRTFPRGLDAEFFTRSAIEIMLLEAREPHHREHVTPYLYEHPEMFSIVDYTGRRDLSRLRLTLDTPEDYALLTHIFAAPSVRDLRLDRLAALFDEQPQLAELNAHVRQKGIKEVRDG